MLSTLPCFVPSTGSNARMEVLFDRLAELTGQRNAIDGRIVDVVAEIERDGIWGNTGCRSVAELVAWKTGVSPHNAENLVAVARRADQFPTCVDGLREGSLSVDQVGVIAGRAADGSDAHYAALAENATVTQLRKAVSLEPTPPTPRPEPKRSISKTSTGQHTTWRITLPALEAAMFEAALGSHQDEVVAAWRREHDTSDAAHDPYADADPDTPRKTDVPVPFPTAVDGFMALVEAGWDADVAARPHGHRTTVVVHLDLEKRLGALHLGPVLTDEDRQYLLCDATCEVWWQKHGQPIGVGRQTRTVNRRLRRALEHRDHGTCVVPGCGATRGLHAHHVVHWEDGGETELDNLVLVCPYHHRAHHRGVITITGPAHRLVVTDSRGTPLSNRSLARPPTTPPPAVAPYKGPTGERAQWWWYTPYEPKAPPAPD